MANFKGIAKDIYTGEEHHYPATKETMRKIRYHFDFIFTKKNEWYYISSHAEADSFIKDKLHYAVEENKEQWKVVNAMSGQIIHENISK